MTPEQMDEWNPLGGNTIRQKDGDNEPFEAIWVRFVTEVSPTVRRLAEVNGALRRLPRLGVTRARLIRLDYILEVRTYDELGARATGWGAGDPLTHPLTRPARP